MEILPNGWKIAFAPNRKIVPPGSCHAEPGVVHYFRLPHPKPRNAKNDTVGNAFMHSANRTRYTERINPFPTAKIELVGNAFMHSA